MSRRFLIVRRDLNLDQVLIESEGLTIGRLTGNDLVLNHPTVSRTQAGIKEIGGEFWIFNLSSANGTLLNGELIEKVPLADGDVVQIGPFILTPRFHDADLLIEVEVTVNLLPVEAPAAGAFDKQGDSGSTVILKLPAYKQPVKAPTLMTMRLSDMTGMLNSEVPGIDDQALKVFWEKRKREAGKLTSESPLQPKGRIRLGKAQFNWRPTLDLQRAWPKSLLAWGAVMVTLGSLLAVLLYLEAFSPAPLSTAHARQNLTVEPTIAIKANANSCTSCHSLTGSMQQNCTSCHTTDHFLPRISDAHEKVRLDCLACHTEHQGTGFRPALVANTSCVNCHRDGSGVMSPKTGKALLTPHGGTLGYPVVSGEWTWSGVSERQWEKKGLTGKAGDFHVKEQFHLVHLGGRQQGRSNCSDCHRAGFDREKLLVGVRESCAGCHSTDASRATDASGARAGATVPGVFEGATAAAPSCVSCHSQHGDERNSTAGIRRISLD